MGDNCKKCGISLGFSHKEEECDFDPSTIEGTEVKDIWLTEVHVTPTHGAYTIAVIYDEMMRIKNKYKGPRLHDSGCNSGNMDLYFAAKEKLYGK